jgi:hypothetical protein
MSSDDLRKDPFKVWSAATIISYFIYGNEEAKSAINQVPDEDGTILASNNRLIM